MRLTRRAAARRGHPLPARLMAMWDSVLLVDGHVAEVCLLPA
jgi:hypothetical protein